MLTDLSGALSIYGVEMQNGVSLGFEYATDGTMTLAGRPVQLIFRDDGSDPDTSLEQARDLGEAVRNACHQTKVRVPESDEFIAFTTSSGVARFNGKEQAMELLSRVDNGLYQAKEAGRDLVAVV